MPEQVPGMPEAPAKPKCEKLLERLTTSADGVALPLLKLRGVGVPTDVEMYVCRRTLVALQVRVKTLDHPDKLVHEYPLEPEAVNPVSKGGIYELQCTQSKHHVQVKVQPPLGLEELLPPYSEEATPEQLSVLLDTEMWPFLALYYVLSAFVSDPTRQNVPLCDGYEDSPKHMEWLLEDQKMVDILCMKCPVFIRSYGSPPTIGLLDHAKPKTRGMLVKALLEVKMLVIRAVTQIRFRGDSLSDKQFKDFEALMMYVYEDCCSGGVEAQYQSQDDSMSSLRRLVCGGTSTAAPQSEPAAGGNSAATPQSGADTESKKDSHSPANGHEKQADKPVLKPARTLPPVTASFDATAGLPADPVAAEQSKLQQLQRKLGDALQNMTQGVENLDEANQLNGDKLKAVRSCLAGLMGQVKRQLDDAEKRTNELEKQKRPRTK